MKHEAIDPFSQKRLAEVAAQFRKGCDQLDRCAAMARIGYLCSQFTDVDLIALNKAGMLTFGDIKTLVRLGRLPAQTKKQPRIRPAQVTKLRVLK